jgi:hypothetical protein
MSCDISKGRLEPCKDQVGGLEAIYIVNWGDITGFTMDGTNTDLIDSVAGTPSAYKFELKGNSSFDQNIVASRENGTTMFEQTLNITLKKQDISTHKELKLLAWGRPQIIVKDYNGKYFMMGKEHGAEVSGGTIVTGAAMGDLTGYTVTFTAMERVPANFIDAANDAGLGTAGFTIVAGS